MPIDSQPNPYESPSAEGAEFEDLHSKSWRSPFRQRIQLAWQWLLLGLTLLLIALFATNVFLLIGILLSLGLGWIIAGCGTFFRARPWITRGVVVNYLAIGCIVSTGIVLLTSPDIPAVVACVILQAGNLIPLSLTFQAYRVLRNSEPSNIPPEH